MKALLVAVNAKYIHSSLGIYCLYAYGRKHGFSEEELCYREYTINQQTEDIIAGIYEEKPDFVGFSCYIWNIDYVKVVSRELRKILPQTRIWLGGPEVSYDGEAVLAKMPWVDGIIMGAGEKTCFRLLRRYEEEGLSADVTDIPGLAVNGGQGVVHSPEREALSMDDIVFPYDYIEGLEHRIIYYESSRGCPYGCSYCLSSVDRQVCFRSMELVKRELQFFLDKKVPQVKFVDRTFNCSHKHTMAIWQYIYEHDNGVTNFHFELSADLLTGEEIEYVKSFRPGLVQFEIGVQSTNPDTILAIHRKMNLDKLAENVDRVRQGRNIHQHLDLIAGLPYEDYFSFQKSFNDVYRMKPDQLQLGFLKVLKGSPMQKMAEEYGIVYQSKAPYEVLFTRWISYEEVRRLKMVEEMVERFYNSMQFTAAVQYLVPFWSSPFSFYDELGQYFKENKLLERKQSRMENYQLLYRFVKEKNPGTIDFSVLRELMRFDLYARENLKSEPAFLAVPADNRKKEWQRNFFQNDTYVNKYLPGYEGYDWKQLLRMTHMEWFSWDIPAFLSGEALNQRETLLLFDYSRRNPLNHQAIYRKIEENMEA